MNAFRRCRRLHYYRYEVGLRPIEDAEALRWGKMQHAALDVLETNGLDAALSMIYQSVDAWRNSQRFIPYTIAATTRAYTDKWKDCPFVAETLATERSFELPLVNPATGRISRTFVVGGKIDRIVRLHNGMVAILETKTTKDNPADDRYWRRLLIDPQISLYYLAARELGFDVQTIMYDVIHKPGKRPLLATPIENRKYKKDGMLYANNREFDETPAEWEVRIFEDMQDRSDFYLARNELARLESDLDEFKHEVWDIAKDIRSAQIDNRHYRSPHKFNCDNCNYFEMCTGMIDLEANPVPDGFEIVENVHPELKTESEVLV